MNRIILGRPLAILTLPASLPILPAKVHLRDVTKMEPQQDQFTRPGELIGSVGRAG